MEGRHQPILYTVRMKKSKKKQQKKTQSIKSYEKSDTETWRAPLTD